MQGNMTQRVSVDRFGQEYVLCNIKDNKKNPEFNQGYVEIGKQLYKLEVSENKKEGSQFWVKLTKMKKRTSGTF